MLKWLIWLISAPFYRLVESDPNTGQTWMANYSVKWRCLNCNIGQPWADKASGLPTGYTFSTVPAAVQVCENCGVSAANIVKWVGRRHWGQWQWVEIDKLPKSIRPSDLELLAQASK